MNLEPSEMRKYGRLDLSKQYSLGDAQFFNEWSWWGADTHSEVITIFPIGRDKLLSDHMSIDMPPWENQIKMVDVWIFPNQQAVYWHKSF